MNLKESMQEIMDPATKMTILQEVADLLLTFPSEIEYTAIKILKLPPVREFTGIDERVYQIKEEGQILKLPVINARPLIERGFAIEISDSGGEASGEDLFDKYDSFDLGEVLD